MSDGKEESLGTDGNYFLGLHGHHVCNGEPDLSKQELSSWFEDDSH